MKLDIYVEPLLAADVVDGKTLAVYIHQALGTPVSHKDDALLISKAKRFFALNPTANWQTMVRGVNWARSKKKRPPHSDRIVDWLRYAWADGALPELDPASADEDTEQGILDALAIETDKNWRFRLLAADGRQARSDVLSAWRDTRVA